MRIHFLIHDAAEMPGAILNWALNNKHAISYTHLWNGEGMPESDSFDSLVIMGGPMSTYDEEQFSWLKPEKEFIRQAINDGRKVLGICLGSQLLADVLGAKVYRNDIAEIGWFPVTLTDEGVNSALLNTLEFTEPVLHWHGDTFTLPENAVHLLKSEGCANQAFSYKEHVLAMQFHIETTNESIESMTDLDRASLIKAPWVMTESEIREGGKYIPANNQLLYSLLERFF